MRIVDHYANALLAGAFGTVSKAAREGRQELERLHWNHPGTGQRRTLNAVYTKITKRSREMGRLPVSGKWSPEEERLVNSYARARLRGKYQSAMATARAYQLDLDGLRKRYPRARWLAVRRTLNSIHWRVLCRLHELGALRPFSHWSGMEERLLDHYARRLLKGEWRNGKTAARELRQEMERRRKRYPKTGWFPLRRTFVAVHFKLWKRARQLGRHVYTFWVPREKRIVRRYVQAFLDGQYPSARQAAAACRMELNRLRREYRDEVWAMVPRSWQAVHLELLAEAGAMGRRWPGTRLSPQELLVAERYARAHIRGRYPTLRLAARACRQELERMRRRHPQVIGYAVRRSELGLVRAVRLRADRLGRVLTRTYWAPKEQLVLDAHARGIVQGRHRFARDAAQAYLQELERRRKKRPVAAWLVVHRSIKAIVAALQKRAHEFRGARHREDEGRRLSSAQR
jgi:hypothetical protein